MWDRRSGAQLEHRSRRARLSIFIPYVELVRQNTFRGSEKGKILAQEADYIKAALL